MMSWNNPTASGLTDAEFDKSYQEGVDIALREVAPIQPDWSEEDGLYIFEHVAYPGVIYGDETEDGARKGYIRALEEFVRSRLNNEIAEFVDRGTSGRGGVRKGAGRPRRPAAKTMRVPVELQDVVSWLREDPRRAETIRRQMAG